MKFSLKQTYDVYIYMFLVHVRWQEALPKKGPNYAFAVSFHEQMRVKL